MSPLTFLYVFEHKTHTVTNYQMNLCKLNCELFILSRIKLMVFVVDFVYSGVVTVVFK